MGIQKFKKMMEINEINKKLCSFFFEFGKILNHSGVLPDHNFMPLFNVNSSIENNQKVVEQLSAWQP